MHNPYAGVLRVTRSYQDHLDDGDAAGVDFGADEGTPIIAPCDGVFRFFWNGTAGYDAVITRADGSRERQCHNRFNRLAMSLNGTFVKEHQHISESGNTGNSTGPHIHANGWAPDGTRRPPFHGASSPAGVDAKPIDNRDEFDMATPADLQAIVDAATARVLDAVRRESRIWRLFRDTSKPTTHPEAYVAIAFTLDPTDPRQVIYLDGREAGSLKDNYLMLADTVTNAQQVDPTTLATLIRLATGTDRVYIPPINA